MVPGLNGGPQASRTFGTLILQAVSVKRFTCCGTGTGTRDGAARQSTQQTCFRFDTKCSPERSAGSYHMAHREQKRAGQCIILDRQCFTPVPGRRLPWHLPVLSQDRFQPYLPTLASVLSLPCHTPAPCLLLCCPVCCVAATGYTPFEGGGPSEEIRHVGTPSRRTVPSRATLPLYCCILL